MQEPLLSDTRLVGGTSLALQIGHRKSTDLDLFSTNMPEIESIVTTLKAKYGYTPQHISEETTIGFIDGIKIDVIHHPYKWLDDNIQEDDIRLATKKDIAAMKMHAITNSGTRPKDFVDIAFLSCSFSYDQISEFTLDKYPLYDQIMLDRAIIYFGDVNMELIENIKMIDFQMNWDKVQKRLLSMTDKPDKVFLNPPLKAHMSE
ncbi:MAG: nucleotidyl transferase AbiEii/AbiGii toxin family protein [Bacteroidales bacterium]|nr:nucleotidyl transferase AbiEii/AbiGii toxin family protein [Bacteroidales bacterium]